MIDKLNNSHLTEDILSFTFCGSPYSKSNINFKSQLDILSSSPQNNEAILDVQIMFIGSNSRRLWNAMHEYNKNLIVFDAKIEKLIEVLTINPAQPKILSI